MPNVPNLPSQPLLSDVEGHLLDIQDDPIREEALRLRATLNKIHWHNGRLRFHQMRADIHLASMEQAAAHAEEAFGMLLQHISKLSFDEDEDTLRRESFTTAMSRPPSAASTSYTDTDFDELAGTVPLTPSGGHVQAPPDSLKQPEIREPIPSTTAPPDNSTQPEVREPIPSTTLKRPNGKPVPTNVTAPVGQSSLTKITFGTLPGQQPLFQGFSPSSPLYAFSSTKTAVSAENPLSQDSISVTLARTSIKTNTANFSQKTPGISSKNKVFLLLNDSNGEPRICTTRAEADTAKGQSVRSTLLAFSSREDAEAARQGCIASRLPLYLQDPAYNNAWFAVLKGRTPTVCQRKDLLKSIGVQYLKDLERNDIMSASKEEDACLLYTNSRAV
ncbi:hypothetical protein VNI00_018355 [Paramarasmius palmivorus]|uniref:Uncharacterized protein n=1 Tax=Paramarasmius palmivorus TaxID=297713 RepID=A0AAW0AYI7_9AGAR